MVPKHESMMNRDDSDTTTKTSSSSLDQPLFGSQLVDENSPTPYSDATQVCG